MSTAAQRLANKLRSRKWRREHPEQSRAIAARSRAKLDTPEHRARKVAATQAWRAANPAKAKASARKSWAKHGPARNAHRRANRDVAKERARTAAWKAAHPDRHRVFYARHREKFVGDGPWSMRSKRLKRAWRKFTQTCAANRPRLSTQEIAR